MSEHDCIFNKIEHWTIPKIHPLVAMPFCLFFLKKSYSVFMIFILQNLNVFSFSFQSWGGKENGFGLADCCKNIPVSVSVQSACEFGLITFSSLSMRIWLLSFYITLKIVLQFSNFILICSIKKILLTFNVSII